MIFNDLFEFIYELILGRNNDPAFRQSIFLNIGLVSSVLVILISAIFYFLLGKWKAVWYNLTHWLITLLLVVLLTLGYLVKICSDVTTIDGYVWGFAAVNSIYVMIFFFLFSVVMKRFSIFSKYTPF